jgi:hypothetical protein
MEYPTKLQLIVSEEKQPKIAIKAGMKVNVIAVQLVDPSLNPASPVAKGTLCGGTSTCLALQEF